MLVTRVAFTMIGTVRFGKMYLCYNFTIFRERQTTTETCITAIPLIPLIRENLHIDLLVNELDSFNEVYLIGLDF